MKPHRAARRRHRQRYPDLKPGEVRLADRAGCGVNIGLQVDPKKPRGVLNGQFVLCRQMPVQSRSKYAPHYGDKERVNAHICNRHARIAKFGDCPAQAA